MSKYFASYGKINIPQTFPFKPFIKVAATDMRYFAKSKFFGSLVHKKDFGGYLFCQGR